MAGATVSLPAGCQGMSIRGGASKEYAPIMGHMGEALAPRRARGVLLVGVGNRSQAERHGGHLSG